MACDTGLVVPEPLRQAGFDNSSFQALPPLEQTLTPALFLFHSTTPPVRMRFFVVLRKDGCITLCELLMKRAGPSQVLNSKLQLTTMV
jgi:hypothetical protein